MNVRSTSTKQLTLKKTEGNTIIGLFGSETVTIPVNRSTKFSILYTILDVAYVDNFLLH